MTSQNPKEENLEDKLDFPEPNARNVEVGDFLVYDQYQGPYMVRYCLIREIIGVSKTSTLVRGAYGQTIIEKKDGKFHNAGQRVRPDRDVHEVKFEDSIILKRDGGYLVGRKVNVLQEKRE